eukprot:4627429-Lingulodinium_polyedra.AAC.1
MCFATSWHLLSTAANADFMLIFCPASFSKRSFNCSSLCACVMSAAFADKSAMRLSDASSG